MQILVTGGLGYIGSNLVTRLLMGGHSVIVVDNYSHTIESAERYWSDLGLSELRIYRADVTDLISLDEIFSSESPDVVFHLAGLKSVYLSSLKYLEYLETNVIGTQNVLTSCLSHNVKRLIFSGSATVYNSDFPAPFNESSNVRPESNYGWTKFLAEQILERHSVNQNKLKISVLRYFNPVGSGFDGYLGDYSLDIRPENLMPAMCKAAYEGSELRIFGSDYETIDGYCVRDFIHIDDLVEAHMSILTVGSQNIYEIYNVGTGRGISVRQLVDLFQEVNRVRINTTIVSRRPGDVAISFACANKIFRATGWGAARSVEDMCKSAYDFAGRFYNG